jgi:RNA polymerase sigma-70 factor (ECF subfamily)
MVIRRIARVPSLPADRTPRETMPEWSDRQLLLALAEGDPRAGLLLYDRLIRIVEWTISRIMGQRSTEHEDLVQAAFEQIVVTLHRQRYAQRCSLTSWASAVSCHVALNALRAQRRQRSLRAESAVQAPEPHDPANLENQLAARQTLERVRAELARMNPSRAQALVLHEVNGLELSEIALALGISVMAAQSRLSRGRRELLDRLGGGAEVGFNPSSAATGAGGNGDD